MSRKVRWIAGIIVVLHIVILIACVKLPVIACYGIKYEWSKKYCLEYLTSIGPRAAGVMFEYHENFNEKQWLELIEELIKNVKTSRDAELFVSSFSNLNVRGYYDMTPLHCAAGFVLLDQPHEEVIIMMSEVNSEITKKLLYNKANVNALNFRGDTPLDCALFSKPLVDTLIYGKGWHLHRYDKPMQSLYYLFKDGAHIKPIDITTYEECEDVAPLLRKYGGKTSDELNRDNNE